MALTKDGLTRKEYRAKWYQENKERIKSDIETKPERIAYKKEYYQDNKEHIQQRYQENKESIRERQREYAKTPKAKATHKAWRNLPENKIKIKKWNDEYRLKKKLEEIV